MQNLSQFKKQAKLGAKLNIQFLETPTRKDRKVQICYVQTNSIVFQIGDLNQNNIDAATKNPSGQGSWFEFPKASKCVFNHNTLTVLDFMNRAYMTLKFIS